MILSVSTLIIGSGAAIPSSVVNLSIGSVPSLQIAHIGQAAGDGGGGGHGRTHQVRPAALALAALEIAVRGRGTALARRQLVGIHGEAHRAAGFAPLEAR